MSRYELLHADCRDVLANMGDESVDSVVTDPPYHLTSIVKRFGPGCAPQQYGTDGAYARAARGFMGQTWDGGDIAFDPSLWAEVLRVLKPGGHLLAFSGSRTYHRMAVAIEDAGFEIRDQIMWLYGSGFPKSHDVSKAIDKAAGAERAKVGEGKGRTGGAAQPNGGSTFSDDNYQWPGTFDITAPATDAARQWNGWGSALKPAHEPIVMARKPLIGSIAQNVLEHGTGALNIDGCRVGYVGAGDFERAKGGDSGSAARAMDGWGLGKAMPQSEKITAAGRFPANVVHDGSDEVLAGFPETESGALKPYSKANRGGHAGNNSAASTFEREGDSGSAARFFYCAKASKADREHGCDALGEQTPRVASVRRNPHPTVKPEALMRYLCRLVTPPGGLVFDPFAGSGSTGKAAMLEGFRFLGAEMTAEYIPVARARIERALTDASN